MRRLANIAGVAIALGLLTLAGIADPASAQDPKKLTILLGIPPGTPSTAAWWIGGPAGFWEEEGIAVEMVGMPNGNVAQGIQLVAAGQADGAVSSLESLLVPASQGRDTGLVFVYSLFPRHNFRLVVRGDGEITSAAQLKGKTVGLFAPGNPSEPLLDMFMKNDGLSLADVTTQVVGVGLPAAQALQTKAVDAVLMVSPVVAVWESANFGFKNLPSPPDFDKLMGPALAVKPSTLQDPERRAAIVGFLRSWAKGDVFALANPEAAIKLNYQAYPQSKPRDVSDEKAIELGVTMQSVVMPDFAVKVDGKWGKFPEGGVKRYAEFLGIADKVPNLDALWSNELIDELNDFDEQAVIDQAKNFK